MKLALLGSTNIGKTNLCYYLSGQEQPPLEYIPTIGVDIMYAYLSQHKKVALYDLAGDERFKKICDSFINHCDILAFCYNISDYSTFIFALRKYNECIRAGYTFNKKVLFIATQDDKTPFENHDIIIQNNIGDHPLFTTSSKNKTGREALLLYLESIFTSSSIPFEVEEEKDLEFRQTILCCILN